MKSPSILSLILNALPKMPVWLTTNESQQRLIKIRHINDNLSSELSLLLLKLIGINTHEANTITLIGPCML